MRNVPAALYKAMGGFATNGVNMTKLESYQLDGRFVATMFYADVEGHPDDPAVARALEELQFFCSEFVLLGAYKASPYRGDANKLADAPLAPTQGWRERAGAAAGSRAATQMAPTAVPQPSRGPSPTGNWSAGKGGAAAHRSRAMPGPAAALKALGRPDAWQTGQPRWHVPDTAPCSYSRLR